MNSEGNNNTGDDKRNERLNALERRFERLEGRLKQLEQKLDELQSGEAADQFRDSGRGRPERLTDPSGDTASQRDESSDKAGQEAAAGALADSVPSRKSVSAASPGAGSARQGSFPGTGSSATSSSWSFLEGSGWLNKLGAVLLIVGLLLLFKYSVERGWITPLVRLATGGVLSLGLLVWGLMTAPDRSRFRQVALGGGLAGLYITGFASYYMYQYLSFGASWGYMLAVTAGALYLSLREDEQVLAVLGIVGGLATPFLLYREGDQFIELILYTSLLLGLSGVIYFYRRWISLLWVAFAGGLAVFGVIVAYGIFDESAVPGVRRWTLQAGLLLYLAVLWPLPMLRSWLSLRSPGQWDSVRSSALHVHMPLIILIMPSVLFLFSIWTWGWSIEQSGIIGMGASAVLGGIHVMVADAFGRNLKQVHLYNVFLLMAISLGLLFGGDHLYAWIAAQMLLMHAAAYATNDERLINVTHLVALFIGLHVARRLLEANSWSLTGANLGEIVTIGSFAGSALLLRDRGRESTFYNLFALAAFLAWVANFFAPVANGQVYVTVSWGVIALLLLAIGYQRPLRIARHTGAGVLLLTLGKLVFYDLSHLGTLWRILLFLGFGIVLLVAGYMLSGKRKR